MKKIDSLTRPVGPNLSTSVRSRADARYTKNDFMKEFFKIKMSNYNSPKNGPAKAPKLATAGRSRGKMINKVSSELIRDREASTSKDPYQTETRFTEENSNDMAMDRVRMFNETFHCGQ